VIELNGRYSASKLMTALAQPGHNRPVSSSQQRSFERRLRSETCRMTYFRTSAKVVVPLCDWKWLLYTKFRTRVAARVRLTSLRDAD
jgi:hypothetical protein